MLNSGLNFFKDHRNTWRREDTAPIACILGILKGIVKMNKLLHTKDRNFSWQEKGSIRKINSAKWKERKLSRNIMRRIKRNLERKAEITWRN